MDEFATLFQRWRERAGLSQNALARRMGVNPAYVNRLEHGGRGAGNRELIEAAADALGLSPDERDALLGAAGHWPRSLAALGPADPSLQLVASVLTDPELTEQDRSLFRLQVRLAALAWRPAPADAETAEASGRLYDLLS
ncbi:MAG TPA: helix-turn-helix domain-containing protein [Chloroflexota bacterium]|nr:helix-turn-helix domain-containing protein [Chloroflexota bacterium]